jgi:hypothetical protein
MILEAILGRAPPDLDSETAATKTGQLKPGKKGVASDV